MVLCGGMAEIVPGAPEELQKAVDEQKDWPSLVTRVKN